MRNRAKCKLCKEILQSFHLYDFVHCKCGEISISGGESQYQCAAKNWENFLRLDDNDNEIGVKVKDEKKQEPIKEEIGHKMNRKQLLEMFESMLKNIEELPKYVMQTPVNHYDFYTYLSAILVILKTPEKD